MGRGRKGLSRQRAKCGQRHGGMKEDTWMGATGVAEAYKLRVGVRIMGNGAPNCLLSSSRTLRAGMRSWDFSLRTLGSHERHLSRRQLSKIAF